MGVWAICFRVASKAPLVEGATYFKRVIRYVVLNPVRAGMVEHPRDYRRSSYRAAFSGSMPQKEA